MYLFPLHFSMGTIWTTFSFDEKCLSLVMALKIMVIMFTSSFGILLKVYL